MEIFIFLVHGAHWNSSYGQLASGERGVGRSILAKRGCNRTARIYHRSPPSDCEGKCCSMSLKRSRACSGVGSVGDIFR